MHVFVTVVVRRVDGTCLSTVLFGGPVVALSQTADPNDDWWRWWRRRFGRLRPRLPSGLHGRPAAERHHRPNRDGTPYTLPLPNAIPSGCFPTQPPVDLVAMMRETAIVECPPREPPELPGGAPQQRDDVRLCEGHGPDRPPREYQRRCGNINLR